MAQPSVMVALCCFTNAKLLWKHAKISLPWQWVDQLGSRFNDTITLPDPRNPHFGSRTGLPLYNFFFGTPKTLKIQDI